VDRLAGAVALVAADRLAVTRSMLPSRLIRQRTSTACTFEAGHRHGLAGAGGTDQQVQRAAGVSDRGPAVSAAASSRRGPVVSRLAVSNRSSAVRISRVVYF
jgi:hypothetical protein